MSLTEEIDNVIRIIRGVIIPETLEHDRELISNLIRRAKGEKNETR